MFFSQKQLLMSLCDTLRHENRTSDNVERSLKPKNFVLFSEQIPRRSPRRPPQNDRAFG